MDNKNDLFQIPNTKVLLAALSDGDEAAAETSLDELERLVDTAGGEVVARVIQNRSASNSKTYLGSGKVLEIAELVKNQKSEDKEGISLIVFDNELSPSQIRNLEDIIDVRVIDRTMLILDIFALHAATGEGKLQVEIACLRYTAPRLMGKGKALSRLGGGIGTRGPGETKLETDRRHLTRRIAALQEKINEMERTRQTQHASREKKGIPSAAIVGYTNAGKSTLLNYLTGAGVLAQDKLFATLDPTTRLLTLPDENEILLTDTVGFIDRLPHQLIKAFKSTLEELKYADMIIMLTDASEREEERSRKTAVTKALIQEMGCAAKETVHVYNKADMAVDEEFIPSDAVLISAKTGEGIDGLFERLCNILKSSKTVARFGFPYSEAKAESSFRSSATVLETEYTDYGSILKAECEKEIFDKYSKFVIDDE